MHIFRDNLELKVMRNTIHEFKGILEFFLKSTNMRTAKVMFQRIESDLAKRKLQTSCKQEKHSTHSQDLRVRGVIKNFSDQREDEDVEEKRKI